MEVRTHVHDLYDICRSAVNQDLVLVRIPVLEERQIQLKRDPGIRRRKQDNQIALRCAGRWVQAMVQARLHAQFRRLRGELDLLILDLDGERSGQHFEVLGLVGMPVQGRFLAGCSYGFQSRMAEVEGHAEEKRVAGRRWEDFCLQCAFQAAWALVYGAARSRRTYTMTGFWPAVTERGVAGAMVEGICKNDCGGFGWPRGYVCTCIGGTANNIAIFHACTCLVNTRRFNRNFLCLVSLI